MTQPQHDQHQSSTAEEGARTVEDINREAAAARATYRQGVEWIEDRRSRPRGTGANSEGLPG
ncbi:MAG: hypothetical protein H0T52_05755 [Lautropia sp.]|nr:hypothetical protein [Lautropia sp.]